MQKTNRLKNSKRRQEVHRQILLLAVVVLVVIGIIVSCSSQAKEDKTKEAVHVETQTKVSDKTADKAETTDQQIKRVRSEARKEMYPEGVVNLLEKNPETVDFVENYGKKKDEPSAKDIGDDYKKGEIPLLLQWDQRWGYAKYGDSIVAVSGCGPTCMAMVAAGLNEDPKITPAKVAAYGTEHSYLDEDNNTYWSFMREAGANWGLSCYEGMLDETAAVAELEMGHPIICSVEPGDFTKDGHFIVLTGVEDGKIKVNDPFSTITSAKLWDYDVILDQTAAMWVYSLDES